MGKRARSRSENEQQREIYGTEEEEQRKEKQQWDTGLQRATDQQRKTGQQREEKQPKRKEQQRGRVQQRNEKQQGEEQQKLEEKQRTPGQLSRENWRWERNGCVHREQDNGRKERTEQPRHGNGGRVSETKTNKTVKFLYTNAQSVQNKVRELEALADDLDPDFILLTETWCNADTQNASLQITGYNLETDLRRDRLDTNQGIGGGLLVYSRQGIKILPIDNSNEFNQHCIFKTGTKRTSLEIILAYRPPSSGTENGENLCNLLRTCGNNTILIGDINMPGVDWSRGTADSRGRDLLRTVQEEEMAQLVSFSTHIKGGMLDLIITNCPERVVNISEEGRLGKSDHSVIVFEVEDNIRNTIEEITGLNWRRADMVKMRQELGSVEWEELFDEQDAEESWDIFRKILQETVDRNVPNFKNKRKSRPQWLTQEIVRKIREKKAAWSKTKYQPTGENRAAYERLAKNVAKVIRNAKRKCERELLREKDKNNRKFTKYIKSKTKARTTIGPLKGENGQLEAEDKQMANILNDFFVSVFTQENLEFIPEPAQEEATEMRMPSITKDKIREKIQGLRVDSAPGPDGINPRLLKELGDSVLTPLEIIFKKSLTTGVVPLEWRQATVIPIFKKGSKREAGNYRPVSLTSIPCKILESILKDEIMEHLLSNGLIKDSQHGFMPGRSCTTNLITFLEKATLAKDNGKPMDVVYLDFSKAFDKVPHRRLLRKMEGKKINKEVIKWIENWLTGRTQRVKVNGEMSEEGDVGSGVPQGTVLGPCLFTIFIDDADDCAVGQTLIIKFADDTKSMRTVERDEDAQELQATLDNLCEWATIWGMCFNVEKCKVMHIGNNNIQREYMMGGQTLAKTEMEKDVGVCINKNLKPSDHCKRTATKATVVLKQILKNFHYRDKTVFVGLYKKYVRPHLEFASPAWSPWLLGDISVLEQVQEKALRSVSGLKGTTYLERCREVDLETLEERRKSQDMTQTFKILKGIDRVREETLFTRVSRLQRTRQAENPLNMVRKGSRTDIRQNSYSVRVVEKWNSLPGEVKSLEKPDAFRRALRRITQY
jgi:hypothetical protein